MKKIYEFSEKYVEEYEEDNLSPTCKVWEAGLKALITSEFVNELSPELQSKIITECMEIKENQINEQMEDF